MEVDRIDLLCMGCFALREQDQTACPVCGYDESAQEEPLYQLAPRSVLAGKYLVGRVLGEGGFGITYIGYDLNLELRVAIKEFYPAGFVARSTATSSTVTSLGSDKENIFARGKERFVEEAKRLAKFRELPGIVRVYDFFPANNTAYIVMGYVEGVTLKNYLAQAGGRLPADMLIELMAPMLSSLSEVHKSGIIHRDISPDNMMLTHEGTLVLLDFGAAREFVDMNRSLSVLLKPGFAPSEQYSTRGIQGPWTDVYALAATVYKVVTGVTPDEAMERVMGDTLQPPSVLGVALPAQQEAAILKGLAVSAKDRFQTVAEFYAALVGNEAVLNQSLGLRGAAAAQHAPKASPRYAPRPAVPVPETAQAAYTPEAAPMYSPITTMPQTAPPLYTADSPAAKVSGYRIATGLITILAAMGYAFFAVAMAMGFVYAIIPWMTPFSCAATSAAMAVCFAAFLNRTRQNLLMGISALTLTVARLSVGVIVWIDIYTYGLYDYVPYALLISRLITELILSVLFLVISLRFFGKTRAGIKFIPIIALGIRFTYVALFEVGYSIGSIAVLLYVLFYVLIVDLYILPLALFLMSSKMRQPETSGTKTR
jgi:serine/threonine protein kinase